MRWIILIFFANLLVGCAGTKYTVDDGRKVNEELLANIRAYGAGEKALRPAIARSASLKDPECDTQWELPISVASAYDLAADDRVAWVRGLGVDERLTVVGAAGGSPLQLGEKIQAVGSYSSENSEKMLLELADRRDAGEPFSLTLFGGKTVKVTPYKVCRGYTRLAPPNLPQTQDYHWLLSMHPLQVARAEMTEDEALWAVLWTQGVSEEGGARMKTYHYGTKIVGTLYNLFTIASGLKGAALAAETAMKAAQTEAANAATAAFRKRLVDDVTAMARSQLRDALSNAAVRQLRQIDVVAAMQQAAANRSSLTGVAWAAATIFDKADVWAYNRLEKLNGNPLAGFSLHQKLIERGLTANSLVLDPERMTVLNALATQRGRREDVVAILGGIRPEDLQFDLADMPMASAPQAFSYDMDDLPNTSQPYARGLIDSMLRMPVASSANP